MFFYPLVKVFRKKCFIFHFMYFLKFLFKKKRIKKENYFTLFYITVTLYCRLFN